jgi:uncharacterized protein (DUF2235 family)
MSKNLAVFFDGTWNEPNDKTNIHLLHQSALTTSSQLTDYIEGVGTKGDGIWNALDKLTGGAFGAGLSANIRRGYAWICQNFSTGDRIFIFGFSRGAYSARSLAGMIRHAGILRDPSDDKVNEAYSQYRDELPPSSDFAKRFREKNSEETDIHFIGVMDTVGSLGIPIEGIRIPGFASHYRFHDTHLSKHVLHAFHAVAANEYRQLYFPTLWTYTADGEALHSENSVEQRWFVGAHADIGGGYSDGCLQTRPAKWLQEEAKLLGLRIDPSVSLDPSYGVCPPHDSYEQFSKVVPFPIEKRPRIWSHLNPINMTIDIELLKRLAEASYLCDYPDYKKMLVELPVGRRAFDA